MSKSETPTDDRGAAALAERLRIIEALSIDPEPLAAVILGERARFLPDEDGPLVVVDRYEAETASAMNYGQGFADAAPELARLRKVEAAAREHIRAVDAYLDETDPEDPDSVTRSEAALRAALDSEG